MTDSPKPSTPPLTLHAAAKHGALAEVQSHLARGVAVDSRDQYHMTPLMYACDKGKLDVATYLLSQGAEVNARETFSDTPLLFAASWGFADIVRLLLAHGAEIDARDAENDTPLTIAAAEGHNAVCSLLIEHGADLNSENDTGWTPAVAAIENGHASTVRLLLEAGADPTGQLTHEASRPEGAQTDGPSASGEYDGALLQLARTRDKKLVTAAVLGYARSQRRQHIVLLRELVAADRAEPKALELQPPCAPKAQDDDDTVAVQKDKVSPDHNSNSTAEPLLACCSSNGVDSWLLLTGVPLHPTNVVANVCNMPLDLFKRCVQWI